MLILVGLGFVCAVIDDVERFDVGGREEEDCRGSPCPTQ